jgi:hypothetical protein
MSKPKEKVLYITGLHGSTEKGLGLFLKSEGYLHGAIELNNAFTSIRFTRQLEKVEQRLIDYRNEGGRKIIANSFGAYLLLQVLCRNQSLSIFDILLISPVLGAANLGALGRIPPQANKLKFDLLSGKHKHNSLAIIAGSDDLVINWTLIGYMKAADEEINLHFCNGEGHQISPEYLQKFIRGWVKNEIDFYSS